MKEGGEHELSGYEDMLERRQFYYPSGWRGGGREGREGREGWSGRQDRGRAGQGRAGLRDSGRAGYPAS